MIVGSWGWMWHFLLVLWRSTARNNYRITCSKILTIERNGQNPISHQAANQQNKVAQTAVPSSLALPCLLCPPCLIAVRLSGCQVAGAAAQCIKHHCDITQAIGGSFTLSIQISVISAISKDHDIFPTAVVSIALITIGNRKFALFWPENGLDARWIWTK